MRYKNSENIYNPIINDNVKDFLDYSLKEKLSRDCKTVKVLQGMEYRPDKISEYYVGSSKYAWAITLINDFSDGLQSYTLFKEIKVPTIYTLMEYGY